MAPPSCLFCSLKAMILEAEGNYDLAEEVYKDILEETNKCDIHSHKRRVAIAKARGNRADAIGKLEEFLKLYQVSACRGSFFKDVSFCFGIVAARRRRRAHDRRWLARTCW